MRTQEEGEAGTRPYLKRREATVLSPTLDDNRHATTDLQRHGQKEDGLNNWLTVNQAGGLHERQMGRNTQ